MLGGSVLVACFVPPTGYAQDAAPDYSPGISISDIGGSTATYTLSGAASALTLESRSVSLTGAAGQTPVAVTGTTTITLNGGRIVGGAGAATGGSAVEQTGGVLTLDLSSGGGALLAGAGQATNVVGAHAVTVDSDSTLIIIGAATGKAASIVGSAALGTGASVGAGIDAEGAIIIRSGNINLASGGALGSGGALNLTEGASLTINAGATLRVVTDAAGQEGITLDSQKLRTSGGKGNIAGGSYYLYDFDNAGTIQRTNGLASAITVSDSLLTGAALRTGSLTTETSGASDTALVALTGADEHGKGSAIAFSGEVNAGANGALVGVNNAKNLTITLDNADVVTADVVRSLSASQAVTGGDVTLNIHNSKLVIMASTGAVQNTTSTGVRGTLSTKITGNSTVSAGSTSVSTLFGAVASYAPLPATPSAAPVFTFATSSLNITPGEGNVVTIDTTNSQATSVALVLGDTVSSSLAFGMGATNIIARSGSVLTLAPSGLKSAVEIGGDVNFIGGTVAHVGPTVSGGVGVRVQSEGRLVSESAFNITRGALEIKAGGEVSLLGGGTLGKIITGTSTVAGNLATAGNFTIAETGYTIVGATTVNGGGSVISLADGSVFSGAVAIEAGSFHVNGNTEFTVGGTVGKGGHLALGGVLTSGTAAVGLTAAAGATTIAGGGNLVISRDGNGRLGQVAGAGFSFANGAAYTLSSPIVAVDASRHPVRGGDGELVLNAGVNDLGNATLLDAVLQYFSPAVGIRRGIYNLSRDGGSGTTKFTYRLANRLELGITEGDHEFLEALLVTPLSGQIPDSALRPTVPEQDKYAARIVTALSNAERGGTERNIIRETIREVRPNATGDATITVAAVGERLLDVVSSRVIAARGDDIGITLANAQSSRKGVAGAAMSGRAGGVATWGEVFFSSTDAKNDENSDGYQASTVGFAVGGDAPIAGMARAGASYAYGSAESKGRGASKSEVNTGTHALTLYGHADFYGLGQPGPFGTVLFGYALNDSDGKRDLPTAQTEAEGSFYSHTVQARADGGYRFVVADKYAFDAYAGFRYVRVNGEAYSESGAGVLNLRIHRSKYVSTESVMGFRLAADFGFGDTVIRPNVHAAWLHDFEGRPVETAARFVGAVAGIPDFTVEGRNRGRESFQGGVGIGFHIGDRISATVGANTLLRKDQAEIGGSGVFRYSF